MSVVVIGQVGSMRAYLDVPVEEAKRRWCESEGAAWEVLARERFPASVDVFEFVDEFWVYEASPSLEELGVEVQR